MWNCVDGQTTLETTVISSCKIFTWLKKVVLIDKKNTFDTCNTVENKIK